EWKHFYSLSHQYARRFGGKWWWRHAKGVTRIQHGAIRQAIAVPAAGYRALPVASDTRVRQSAGSQDQGFCASGVNSAQYGDARPWFGVAVAEVGVSPRVRRFQRRDRAFP